MSGPHAAPPTNPGAPPPGPHAPPTGPAHVAGVVLAGGKSRRFGSDKAAVLLGGRTLLDRALDTLRPLCGRLMAAGTRVRPAVADVQVVDDVFAGCGPISGIHAALAASPLPYALVVAVDMVALKPDLLELIRDWPEPAQVAVPFVNGYYEPLCARYHTSCLPVVEENIRAGRRKVFDFYPQVTVARVSESELRRVDPQLVSFRNVNTPDDLAEFEA